MLTRERDDTGVVAIIVALSVSTFLLGFAALAVDLGAAYARQTDIQSTAEELAMAGAAGLPTIEKARAAVDDARRHACERDRLPGICDVTGPGWEKDGDLSNGEVRFYDDRGQSGVFADLEPPAGLDPDDFLAYSATEATGIRVLLPPSTVEFGLASAIGFDSVKVTRAATARIGTPLGEGILPFALTPGDLNRGEFCATDNRVTGDQDVRGDPSVWVTTNRLGARTVTVQGGGDHDVTLYLNALLGVDEDSVVWHATNSTNPDQAVDAQDETFNRWTVTVPANPPNTRVWVWATGNLELGPLRFRFRSQAAQVIFAGDDPPDDGLCGEAPAFQRGYLDLARADTGGLADNVRKGPQTKLYNASTPLGGQILRSTDCATNSFDPSTACASVNVSRSWSWSVQQGLLTSDRQIPGRLARDCGNDTVAVPGGAKIDASRLIDGDKSPFLSDRTPQELRDRILGHGTDAAADGWEGTISSRAMRCARLAVMPVVEPFSVAGVINSQKIVKFVYVWLDQADTGSRGLRFTSTGKLTSVRGYVLQPGFFPKQVAGSPVVGPYLGDDMPREVVLVHDLGSPGT
jgi:hypothetical protein